jgi:hypothetical protein
VGLATRYYFLSECCCLKFEVLYLWGALSDERIDTLSLCSSLNIHYGPYSAVGDIVVVYIGIFMFLYNSLKGKTLLNYV